MIDLSEYTIPFQEAAEEAIKKKNMFEDAELREIVDVFERTLLEERASARQNASEAGKVGGEMKDLAFGEFSAAAHGLERFLQVQHVIVVFCAT